MNYKISKGTQSGWAVRRFIPFRWSKFKKRDLHFDIEILSVYPTLDDRDLRFDWSKLFGVNLTAFKASNVNSIMVGFRSDDTQYEGTLYRNSNKSAIYDNNKLVFTPRRFTGYISYLGEDKYEVKINEKVFTFTELNRTWLCRYIFPWFGGKDDDNNWKGGHSPVDLKFKINYSWHKK